MKRAIDLRLWFTIKGPLHYLVFLKSLFSVSSFAVDDGRKKVIA
jgi:hypothetical protein